MVKIGVVGLGLIGGSILKGLSEFDVDVVAVTRTSETLEKAKGLASETSLSIEALEGCDIVFVATPMNQTEAVLDELEYILDEKTLVCDVCSLKRFLQGKNRLYKYVSTHPMAGSEHKGFDFSDGNLFRGSKWVITPNNCNISVLLKVIKTLGAEPVLATAERHDEVVALISHMPMVLSQALFKTAKDDELAMKLASSGFRDMTRLAMTNEEMASDMVNLNSDNIQKAILALYTHLGDLLKDDYRQKISEIKYAREKMYQDGKNIL